MTRTTWTIDRSHSTISFSVRHLMIARVRGTFGDWEGTLDLDEADPASALAEVRIRATSIDTKDHERDAHLRSADFLDVGTHPEIHFAGTAAGSGRGGRFRMAGDLTIRGATGPVTLDVRYVGRTVDPWGDERLAYTATAVVDRTRWGLVWNAPLEAGGLLVGERVDLEFDVQAVRGRAG